MTQEEHVMQHGGIRISGTSIRETTKEAGIAPGLWYRRN
jgi:hypothetical protein